MELLTGLLLVLVWYQYGFNLTFLHYSTLILFLLPISFIDLDTKLILNVLTFPGMAVGLILAMVIQHLSFLEAIMGLLVGGGFLWLIGLLGSALFKKESMGGGDVKLGAMIGVFIGPEVIIALFLAFFIALPVIAVGLTTRRIEMESTLPFGPFISLGTIVIVCFGSTLYTQYFILISHF